MESFNILLLTVAVTVQVTSHDSTGEPPVQISKPKVTLNPSHAVLYSTETVTLHCEVPEALSGLQYDWYKNSADLSEHQPSITARGSGKYECKAKKGTSESEISASYTLTLQDPPKAKLTVDPKWTEFFPSENIELKCEIEGGSSGWTFEWIKDTWTSEGDSVRAITVKHPDSGKYSCRGKLKNRQVTTQQSNAFQLNVKDLPEPKIQSDWTEAFPGEKVYLECVIQGVSENWNYMWFKDSRRIVSSDETNINTLTLSVKSSHHGAYECQGELQGRKVSTARSTQHLLTVHELPQLKLSIESQWNMFYPTEKVTLKCSIDEESNKWGYEWFKNGGLLKKDKDISFSGNTLSISSAKAGHSGQYTCRGKHLTRTLVTTRETEAVQLRIQDIKPKPTITKHKWFELFYTEERVQLHCNMPGVGWEYHWYKGSTLRITHPELTIDAVSLSDSGNYHCKAQRGDFSVDSETLQVRVQKPPQPHIQSDWTEAFPGEKVSLQCVIRDVSENWNYTWFKDSSKIDSRAETNIKGNNLTLSVKSSHHGAYECQAELQERNVSTVRSKQHLLTVHGSQPTILLQQDPSHAEIYTGEQVKLTCSIQEKTSKWQYFWQIDSQQVNTVNNPIYTIQNATLSQKGNYTCQVRRGEMTYANSTILTIREPPQPHIQSDWTEAFPGEKVSLQCVIRDVSKNWNYTWFKDSSKIDSRAETNIQGNNLTLSVKSSHHGAYECQAELQERNVSTVRSKQHFLTVHGSQPTILLQQDPSHAEIYTGEQVKLTCSIQEKTSKWQYFWQIDSQQVSTVNNPIYTTQNATLSQKGNYTCQIRRGEMTYAKSTILSIREPPQPHIQSDWTEAFPGEKVSLQCVIRDVSENWNYTWFKDSSKIDSRAETNIQGNNLTLSVKSSHHGAYECQAESQERNVSTVRSKQHFLTVHGSQPTILLQQDPSHAEIYTGEQVKLTCSIQEKTSKWQYFWQIDSQQVSTVNNPIYTIQNATLSQKGNYTCQVRRGEMTYAKSTILTIREPPKANMSIESQWNMFYPTEKVTLKCSVDEESNKWGYEWFKNGGSLKDDKDISVSRNTLSISSAKVGHSGQYTCRGKHLARTLVTTTRETEAVQLRIQDIKPKPNITKHVWFELFYAEEKVQLKCNMTGVGWEYHWYKGSTLRITHPELTIDAVSLSDRGNYHCKAKRGDFSVDSETLQVRVQKPPQPHIQSDWTEAFPGEKVSLQCVIRDVSENWNYTWFKDSSKIDSRAETNIQGNNLTLSVKSSHHGAYECQAELQERNVSTVRSKQHFLTVHGSQPTILLQQDPSHPEMYNGEQVNLTCSIQEKTSKWQYFWQRDSQQVNTVNNPIYTIQNATFSQKGNYTCQVRRGEMTYAKSTILTIREPPQPHIQSDWTEAFPGEKVSLQCVIRDVSENWNYTWFKDSSKIDSRAETNIQGNNLTLSVKSSHHGAYECQAELQERNVSTVRSKQHFLTVHGSQPTILLQQDPSHPEIYTGEQVKLTCSIQEKTSKWQYFWQIDSQQVSTVNNTTIYTIQNATLSQKGNYTCQVRRGEMTYANSTILTIREPPKANMSIESQWNMFYPTEKVTLKCSVDEESNKWGYEWFKNGGSLKDDKGISVSRNTLSISSAKVGHSGQYTCRGKHLTRTLVTTRETEAVQLRIQDIKPKPNITKHVWFELFYTEERVQLKCNMTGVGWEYHWYKGSTLRITHPKLTIDAVSLSDSGNYHCKAKRGDFSVDSETLQVRVQKPPQPHIQSDWTEAFHGEKVSLQCVIQDVSENWNYTWFKDSSKIISRAETNIKGNNLTLSVKSSHHGAYECQAELQERNVSTVRSTQHLLTVHEPPKPNLSIESQWNMFYPTEKVTLKCSVDEESNKWGYEWFKNGGSLKKVEDISFSGNTLSISSAKAGHSGQYTCRGKHLTRTLVTTRETEAVQLRIKDITPKPIIKKHEWFELFYTEERVKFDCNMSGVGWEYHWHKAAKPLIKNSEFTIDAVSLTDTGDYHCKAQRGDFSVDSETLQVRVQARPPAFLSLKTELIDIMTGDVTLRCNISDGRQWNYTWFMNGQQLNGSSDVLKVTGNEETIKSEFKCKGINTERPLYSALSDGFVANNIIFKRKILLAISGCLVCCIFILIIGCIILKITHKPEVKETPEDLFFSMTDSKNQIISPMKEYMDNRQTELEESQGKAELISDCASAVHEDSVIKESQEKAELISDCASAVHEDSVIKEDTSATVANGLTSFKGL
ncbi:titin isoform X8 [Carassius gibelio]|uniref:titin isoform X7 n=1 Tax=Carassius gibelio TaxID=101364 RepID=UPI002277E0F2|nr:titin isoform X7 [Carassius gibelio]XP_052396755.1 titin isoform X8 [Carassius gibelio]